MLNCSARAPGENGRDGNLTARTRVIYITMSLMLPNATFSQKSKHSIESTALRAKIHLVTCHWTLESQSDNYRFIECLRHRN